MKNFPSPVRTRRAEGSKGNFWAAIRKWAGWPFWSILALLLINIAIGYSTVPRYGESWDENLRYKYAAKSLKAYAQKAPETISEDEKGPAFGMLAYLGASFWQRLRPDWDFIAGWHFMIFLSFQLAVWGLYMLCRQLVDWPVALGAALLFSTQPLLWGHAFINPKDIPFMAFFLASLAVGVRMVTACKRGFAERTRVGTGIAEAVLSLRGDWQILSEKSRLPLLVRLGFALLVGLVILAIGHNWILANLRELISALYFTDRATPVGQLFERIAQNTDSVRVESYIEKGRVWYLRLFAAYLLGTVGLLLVNAWLYFRRFTTWCWGVVWQTGGEADQFAYPTRNKVLWLLAAGILLGFTAAIRVLGPLAGLLVSGYFIYKAPRRAWLWLPFYGCLAALVTYFCWPGIWQAPLQQYLEFLSVSANFKEFSGQVLFGGHFYNNDALPVGYLPELMALQFTEPALLLMGLGLVALVWHAWRGLADRGLAVLLLAWFLLPAVGVVLFHSNLYDNFRHMLFITPPLFVFAGYGLRQLFRQVKTGIWKLLILAVVIFPGIYWNIQLYPYEYVYYNSLVGGVRGAFRRYEMDYWATSYREATEFLNRIAPDQARVYVRGPEFIVSRYARPDLVIVKFKIESELLGQIPGYVILPSRYHLDLEVLPDQEPIFSIGRQGAIFTVIKWLPEVASGY
jgi:hypothetical protein